MITYHKFDVKDIAKLPELTLLSFGRETPVDYYRWKYLENPEGEVVAYVAKNDSNTIVGFYGLIPEHYYIKGQRHLIYQSCDTMTHPDYRRMGIFEKLANHTYNELIKEKKLLVKGFAGEMSFPGFVKKLNWKSIETIKPFFKNNLYLRAELFVNSVFSSKEQLRTEDTTVSHTGLNTLDEILKTKFQIVKTRGSSYWEWRLKDMTKPHRIIYFYSNDALVGYSVYCVENENLLLIRDLFSIDERYTGFMLRRLYKVVLDRKLKGIYSWSNKESHYEKLFKSNLFLKNPFKKGAMSSKLYFIILENNSVFDSTMMLNSKNWNLLPVDYDF